MNLDELKLYMKSYTSYNNESNDMSHLNNSFTQLLLDNHLHEAMIMIEHNKNIKFNTTMMITSEMKKMKEFFKANCDYNDNGYYTCNKLFNAFVTNICIKNLDYMDVILLLRFLTPKNMVGSHIMCNTCKDYMYNIVSCYELTHNYENYISMCIHNKRFDVARAIYIMFDVNNLKLLKKFYIYDDLANLKIVYNIITQSQNVIPVKRRNIPILDITDFVSNYVSFDIVEWYHTIKPCAYTKEKIDIVLKLVSMKDENQLCKFEKFFKSIYC
jgi:hypothetical protein